MSIRVATLEDIPALVAIGALMHAESPRYSRLSFSPQKLESTLRDMIEAQLAIVLVAVIDSKIVGAALGFAQTEWFTDELVAQELAVYVVAENRGSITAAKLIAALDAWAERVGARWLQAGVTTGVNTERAVDLYAFMGFERVAVGVERVYNRVYN